MNDDLIFVKEELNKVLQEAGKYAQKDNETKKEYILRLKEKVQTLFRLEAKPKAELASYIWGLLEDIEFDIGHSHFYTCFTDEEKGKYSQLSGTGQFYEEKPGLERNPLTGQIRMDGVTYTPDLPSEAKPKSLEPTDRVYASVDEYTDLLRIIQKAAIKLQTAATVIELNYENNKKFVQSALSPIKDKTKEYAKYYAVIANSKEVLDDRNKWGDYEKSMAWMLMNCGETIAHIAKLMDYSSKFGSIGILNNSELQGKMKQLGECPNCHCNIHYEINERLKQAEIEAQLIL